MRKKSIFKLFIILAGIISMTLNFGSVQASEIISVFNGETISRQTMVNYASNERETSIAPITLGITKSEYKTNGGDAGKTYWTIKDSNNIYKDLYCLNLSRGFGAPDGNVTSENSTKRYNNQFDLNTISNSNYTTYTGLNVTTKNKILWILNNSLTSEDDLKTILTLASEKVEDAGWASYVREDMKNNNDSRTKLTFDDIKMIQQIAIWHYTNNKSIFDVGVSGICDSQGRQLSSLGTKISIDTDTYWGSRRSGEIKLDKFKALYKYFIDGAENATSSIVEPELTLAKDKDFGVAESGDNYVVGPFVLNMPISGTNVYPIKEITATVNKAYKLLNSSKTEISNNDFNKVVGKKFYLKIAKNQITENTQINIALNYKYDIREVILLTNTSDYLNTQPAVFVKSIEKDANTDITADINITGASVEKIWNDNNNQDNVRSKSIKVQLYKDNAKYGDTITLNQSNNWKCTWNKLLDGVYTVKELNEKGVEVLNGGKYNNDYTTSYRIEGNNTTITNTHVPVTIDISGTKTWQDNNNQDGKRPESITVNLLKNGTKVDSVNVTASDNWKYSFNDIPKYDNGVEIKYTITEDAVTGYEATISGYNITNKHTPEKITISGTKTWDDNNNQDGRRPTSITVNLLKNGNKIDSKTVIASKNWKYTFTDLPKYEKGVEIKYTITEDAVEEYEATIDGYNITNKYTPGKVSKTVIKKWEDANNADEIRPDKITVELYKIENGQEKSIETKELNQSNNWTYTWAELNKKEKGVDIVYGIKEISAIEGYATTYDYENFENVDTITITNTHVSKNLAIGIQKVDKDGNIITSTNAKFEISGAQNITSETNQGILELDSQRLVGNTFEFTYTIKEIDAPTGYNKISDELNVKISGTTKTENGSYIIDTINLTDKDGKALDNSKISAEYDRDLNKVIIKIVNTKIESGYSVKLLKVNEDGTTALNGAWFKVNGGQAMLVSENGQEIETGMFTNDNALELTYNLEETIAPNGYVKIDGVNEVKIKAEVELKDNVYQITKVELLNGIDKINISEENNVITIKVKNDLEITGKYNIKLRKVDENGNILKGSKFEINAKEYDLVEGEISILEDTELTSTDDIILTYNIKETKVPDGYIGIDDTSISIKAKVIKEGNNYKITRVNGTLQDESEPENINVSLEGSTIVIAVKNTPQEKQFDLALRKFITKVNDIEYSREPVVDTSTIATNGTATYKHTKQPIAVQKGDIVTYTIRVYNEGEIAGYVDKITDYIPENLLPIIVGTESLDQNKYKEEMEFNLDWGWIISEDGKSVTTMKTAKTNSETYALTKGFEDVTDTKLEVYVEGSDKLDYIDVQIKCLVTNDATDGEFLTNIAEISESQDINGNKGDGADSKLGNVDFSNLSDYKNDKAIDSTTETYIPGQEDDDDFEKVVVKEFDLALRKFIVKVNETTYSREPVVDTSKLGTTIDNKVITTAIYNHSKEPVIVKTNDIVTYTIRIYNEGTLDGFANEITDNIPEGLEFIADSQLNVGYKWKMLDAEGRETTDNTKAVMIVTDYLSDSEESNKIEARTETEGVKTLNYKDVQVQFKVIAEPKNLEENIIINEAQISKDTDRDIDSNPNRDEKFDYITENNEDDIDYEPVKLQYFDLALRKFVTKVNSVDYNNRYPEVIYNDNGSITYTHTKDPVLVTTGDTVTYTIRVYNEGEISGYASEIKDNLPVGLAFDPNNETNKLYAWKMIDKDGNVTEDAESVVAFKTNYLENERIDALVETNGSKILSYKDVQIAFVVTESEVSDRILVNIAQISADSEDDIDSNPDNNVESEDDTDKEYVRVEYFDLALKKWVTATKVTLDGKTTTTKTNYGEDSEAIAKVDIVASKLKKTTVKFVYNIKVTNEGELSGYAYEVKDYIPKGLKFIAEDNKDWKEVEDGVVVTDKLKDTLLNPGESAIVEIVLTWKNSSTNLGLKTNYAEISSDSANDIDSTPDNYDFTEDDMDDAQVILSIKTAGATTYVGLILITVAILAGGVFLIKKYVLN